MAEQQDETTTPPADTTAEGTDSQKSPEEIIAELTADRDRWKHLSRQNEKNYEAASAERDQLKQAQMTDSEKAIEQARTEGRNSALSELGTDLAKAEMAAAAAKTGAQLPDAQYLNIGSFLGADGRPNKEAIESFVTSLPKATPQFPQLQGAGASDGAGSGFASLDPTELADYITDGSIF